MTTTADTPETERTYEPASNVVEALARCIADVRAVGKDSRNNEQKYSFRGVDAVVNAVHQVLVKHRVVVVPHAAHPTYTPVTSKSGTSGRFVDIELVYRIYGPGGPEDHIDATVYGESADYGDKATAKAFSVGYRICLLQVLNLPTDDPDPDAGQAFEHVSAATARNQQVPDLPKDLADAREAVRGAWAFLYGGFNRSEVEQAYMKWSGAVLNEATPGDLRKFAAYLSAMPATVAGGNPSDMPPPDAAGGEVSTDVGPRMASERQRVTIIAALNGAGYRERAKQLEWLSNAAGEKIESRKDLTADHARLIFEEMTRVGMEFGRPGAGA